MRRSIPDPSVYAIHSALSSMSFTTASFFELGISTAMPDFHFVETLTASISSILFGSKSKSIIKSCNGVACAILRGRAASRTALYSGCEGERVARRAAAPNRTLSIRCATGRRFAWASKTSVGVELRAPVIARAARRWMALLFAGGGDRKTSAPYSIRGTQTAR
ncbi:hypothetical protein C8R46DRAFT_1078534 [Mycena filopes]|nr:hypothetical protein C8R46DRAFT_1078534 [Mycena filopes]